MRFFVFFCLFSVFGCRMKVRQNPYLLNHRFLNFVFSNFFFRIKNTIFFFREKKCEFFVFGTFGNFGNILYYWNFRRFTLILCIIMEANLLRNLLGTFLVLEFLVEFSRQFWAIYFFNLRIYI